MNRNYCLKRNREIYIVALPEPVEPDSDGGVDVLRGRVLAGNLAHARNNVLVPPFVMLCFVFLILV